MKSEYQILTHLSQTGETSQRKLATRTGVSVGTVNLLLKKMVRKGLVKLERVNGRTLRYIITPKGMAEKSRLAYQYLKSSYQQIIKINRALEQAVADETAALGKSPQVIFYGPADEILEILKLAASDLRLNYRVLKTPAEISRLLAQAASKRGYLVVTWKTETTEEVPVTVPKVNILSLL